ncbi:MAG TPA: c-type cytochrome [Usitatibacter sp.]|nr:c-type cytochrome [Usitatibacter sp.]
MSARAAAVLAASLAASAAFAQPATVKTAPGDNLRSLYANSQDVAEGKRVSQECVRCHNDNGISTTPGVPHLAGQRAPYLHLQLRAYKRGDRAHSPVTGAVKFLDDDALMKVSAYFASLDPPKAAPAPRSAASSRNDPVQVGKAVAQQCSGCHGDNGVSSMPGTPSLVALDPKYFGAAMAAYKNGQRKNDLMKPIAAGLSDIDTNAVALYYALLKPARSPNPAKVGDAGAGKAAATSCAGCHGDNGNSTSPETPSLAGQDAEYLHAATRAYKDGSRTEEAMKGIAGALDDKTMKDLAAYYAAQSPQQLAVRKPLGLTEWVDRCDRCHGVNGNSTDPMIPALAAQRADWLEAALNAYRKGERKSSAMSAMSSQLTEADVKEIAAYYSRQTARPIAYVILPK